MWPLNFARKRVGSSSIVLQVSILLESTAHGHKEDTLRCRVYASSLLSKNKESRWKYYEDFVGSFHKEMSRGDNGGKM